MNAQDRKRLTTLTAQVETLLNAPPKVNPRIRNIDVLEAFLGDVQAVTNGNTPTALTFLTREAKEAGEL